MRRVRCEPSAQKLAPWDLALPHTGQPNSLESGLERVCPASECAAMPDSLCTRTRPTLTLGVLPVHCHVTRWARGRVPCPEACSDGRSGREASGLWAVLVGRGHGPFLVPRDAGGTGGKAKSTHATGAWVIDPPSRQESVRWGGGWCGI